MPFMKTQNVTPVRAVLACLVLASTGALRAETVSDPTRPPDAWLALQPQAAPTGLPTDPTDGAGARVTVLGRTSRFAVVDGQVVKVGDVIRGAKVVAISAETVTLQESGGRRVLSLTPGVVKKNRGKP